MPPFFNRNGLYQVVTKKYLKTIKYKDNVFVLYKYIDTDYDDEEMQEDNLLFFSDAVVWKYDIMLQVLQRKANL